MKKYEVLKCVGTAFKSEAQDSACGIGGEAMGWSNDLPLHLLCLDYPFPAASIYFNHDDYGSTALIR